jgi:YbgC/YbaW family acyl-CoA thioester hydrolase
LEEKGRNVFRTTRRVEFGDTDMAGLIHFSNYFRYMEAAECEFLRARGLSVKQEWEGQPLGFPRRAASCEFIKPARFEDVLDVTVKVEKIGTRSVTYVIEFAKNGDVVARGQVTSVCCRVDNDHQITPIDIPASYRARLEKPT